MSKNELEKIWDLPSELPYRERVEELQQTLINAMSGDIDVAEEGEIVVYPSQTKYNHYFSDGLYVREMFCEKGYLGFTIIHNTANPLFLMKGKVAFAPPMIIPAAATTPPVIPTTKPLIIYFFLLIFYFSSSCFIFF